MYSSGESFASLHYMENMFFLHCGLILRYGNEFSSAHKFDSVEFSITSSVRWKEISREIYFFINVKQVLIVVFV